MLKRIVVNRLHIEKLILLMNCKFSEYEKHWQTICDTLYIVSLKAAMKFLKFQDIAWIDFVNPSFFRVLSIVLLIKKIVIPYCGHFFLLRNKVQVNFYFLMQLWFNFTNSKPEEIFFLTRTTVPELVLISFPPIKIDGLGFLGHHLHLHELVLVSVYTKTTCTVLLRIWVRWVKRKDIQTKKWIMSAWNFSSIFFCSFISD